ncbi:hypothetical protein BN1050_00644 [Metalysinibacillus saudimassiliensis]|uniref:Cardiolipin synthase N-terminal domain-containing protein n=1 Tax=Metalysinibacillus saudimassiliensis TaxID=1461583 RepID=A0A078M5B8_9BACL|nr:hypothetical protein BN1050_00644 [Metalysinibacillus saudimassiliensis]
MNTDVAVLIDYLPFLLPLFIVQLTLGIFSAVHVVKHPNYRFGNQAMWLVVVLFIQFIGPLVYFVFGRGER